MILLFTSSDNIISRIIRRFTWHWTSHVAITDGTTVWECEHIDGCSMKPYAVWLENHEHATIEKIEIQIDKEEVVKRLNAYRGYDYDFFSLVRHLFRTDSNNSNQLNCVEYIAQAINYDMAFFSHVMYHRLQPRHLYVSAYSHNKAINIRQ